VGRCDARQLNGDAPPVFAGILLTLGVMCLVNFGSEGLAMLAGVGLLLGGVWNLAWGLIWVADRLPLFILGAEAFVDCRALPETRISWDVIGRAKLSRTTRNGSEESATLMLWLFKPVGGQYQLEFDLTNVDCGSQEILRIIGERADLRQ
jgi:hypothetical protein